MISVVGHNIIRLCRPKIYLSAQFNKIKSPFSPMPPSRNISKHLYERGKADENVHFLKLQREQLKVLRQKILDQKKLVTSKINQVDEKISSLEKSEDQRKKIK
ncbi:hypothetical protein KR074_004831 [Drosophila pseudoananassae]|nr:hypothetical protein KR074_004831 [Drosophila pseudoananassae]